MIGHCVSKTDKDGFKLIILTEYMSKGSLANLLRSEPDLSYRRRLSIIVDVIGGVTRMHEKHFMHRDIRPDNILVDGNYKAKLGDMGIAKMHRRVEEVEHKKNKNKTKHTLIGCPAYMPEEFYTQFYSEKLDIFTFGLTLNELFGGEHEEDNEKVTITKKAPVFTHFVDLCTHKDPAKRPSAKVIEKDLKFFYRVANGLVNEYFEKYVKLDTKNKNKFFMVGYEAAFKYYTKHMMPKEEETSDVDSSQMANNQQRPNKSQLKKGYIVDSNSDDET